MTTTASRPPPIAHVLETVLYVNSIDKAREFYQDVMGLECFLPGSVISGFSLGNTILLLFQLGLTTEDTPHVGGLIPGDGPTQAIRDLLKPASDDEPEAKLRQHYCLAATSREDVVEWERWFKEKEVPILGTVDWEKGGRSVYFADPDGHIGEIGSTGIWPVY